MGSTLTFCCICYLQVASNLTELSLNRMAVKMLQQQQFPADIFHRVNFLHLLCFNLASEEFPFDFLQKFPSVERLHVGCCQFKEMLPDGAVEEKHVRFLAQVRWLKLDWLPNLQHVQNANCSNGKVLQDLEHLEINNCDSLVSLLPFSSSFPNITALDVVECKGLVNIVTSSMARILVNLKKLSIRECNMVTEIVVEEEDESDYSSSIIFNKLESITLHCLNSLISFCSASCIIEFPSLEDLFVRECPRMKVFSPNVIRAPKLKEVYLTDDKFESWAVDDLNETIVKFHSELVFVEFLFC